MPSGAAQPTFSANNGTTTGEDTTATFYAAGTYVFTASMYDSGNNAAVQTVTVIVNQTPTAVVVAPSPAVVDAGTQQSFIATLDDQFGYAIASGFTWAVTVGGGSVDSSGNYTAPGTAGTATLTATSSAGSIQGTAAINVVVPVPAAPASLAATVISVSEIDLSWPAAAGATGYNVYRGGVSGDESVVPLNTSPVTGTTYRDLSVSEQTTYFYVVQAVNATGIGAASAEAAATTPPPLVTFTQNLDIGAPQQAGSEQYATGSGVYTVAGGGADIWGSSDSFHFDALSLSGNGSIVAQVTSVQGISPAAKAGLMFRDSTAANAMTAMLAVTPGAGPDVRNSHHHRWAGYCSLAPVLRRRSGSISPRGEPVYGLLLHCRRSQQHELDTSGLDGHGADVEHGTRGAGGYGDAVAALNTSTFSGVSVSSSGGPQAVPAPNPGVLEFTASTSSIRIACDPGDANSVNVYVNSAGTPASTIPHSEVTQWEILGGTGDDQLTVDFSNGDPLPAGGLSFDGSAPGGGNGLTVIGSGPNDNVTLSPTQLTLDGSPAMVYSNVQTVALSLSGGDCSLAGTLAAGTSLVLNGSGSITPAVGFRQTGNLTVTSGAIVLNDSTNLASGAALTVGAASAFDASADVTAGPDAAPADVDGVVRRVGPGPGYLRSGSASAGPPLSVFQPIVVDRRARRFWSHPTGQPARWSPPPTEPRVQTQRRRTFMGQQFRRRSMPSTSGAKST